MTLIDGILLLILGMCIGMDLLTWSQTARHIVLLPTLGWALFAASILATGTPSQALRLAGILALITWLVILLRNRRRWQVGR